jgi:hypothetical protein
MRRHRSGAWFLTVLLGTGICGAQAPRTSARVTLRFTAPPECPDDFQLVSTIEGFLSQPLSAARRQLSIEARIQGEAVRGYSAKVTFVSDQGSMDRYLEHPDCSKLVEAVGLVAALAIAPERVRANQQAGETAKAPPAPSEAVARPAREPPVEPPRPLPAPAAFDQRPLTQTSARNRFRAALSLSGQAVGGVLPNVAPGLGAELSLRFDQFELGMGGRTWAARNAAVPSTAGASVALSFTTIGLRMCRVSEWDDWSLVGCARGDWGRMSASGEGVDAARSRHAQLWMLGSSLALRRSIGRLEPFGGLELFAPLARPRFGVLQEGREIDVFKPEGWGWGAFLGLGYAL